MKTLISDKNIKICFKTKKKNIDLKENIKFKNFYCLRRKR